jgi:hypothetical protein
MKNFFLEVRRLAGPGGKRIFAMTHLPRVFTFDEARDLAVQLAVLAGTAAPGPSPVPGTAAPGPSPVPASAVAVPVNGNGEGI